MPREGLPPRDKAPDDFVIPDGQKKTIESIAKRVKRRKKGTKSKQLERFAPEQDPAKDE